MLFLLFCALSGCAGSGGETCAPISQQTALGVTDTAVPAGYEFCGADEGPSPVNRVEAVACAADAATLIGACEESDEYSACSTDADCGGGFCGADHTYGVGCDCYDVCQDDAGCDASEACICPAGFSTDGGGGYHSFGSYGECRAAECHTGADCASGECGVAWNCCGTGGDAIGLYCRSEADECRSNDDCSDGLCSWDGDKFACTESCTCE